MSNASEGGMDSAWGKLCRRKVVQWGLAYAAGAWGLLQGLQFLADTYDWPSQVLRLVTLVLVLASARVPISTMRTSNHWGCRVSSTGAPGAVSGGVRS